MLSVGCMGESVYARSWLYGRVSRCSQFVVYGRSVGALSWLYGRVSRCSQLAVRCSQWFVWESQYTLSWLYTGESVVLSVVCMGESVDALR